MGTFDFTGTEGFRIDPTTKAVRVIPIRKLENPLNHFPQVRFHPMIRTDQFPRTFSTGDHKSQCVHRLSIG